MCTASFRPGPLRHTFCPAGLGHAATGTVQADLCGSDRTTEEGGCLLERHLAEVVQQDQAPRCHRQLAHRIEQAAMRGAPVRHIFCPRHRCGRSERIEQRGNREPVALRGAYGRVSCAVSQVVAPHIESDAPRPGTQRCSTAKARQPAQDVNNGFLCQVLRQHGIASTPGKKADQVCAQAFSGLPVEHNSAFRWVGRRCHH